MFGVNAIEASYFTDLGYPMSADEARSRFKGKTMVDVAFAVESAVGDGLRRDWLYDWGMATALGLVRELRALCGIEQRNKHCGITYQTRGEF